MNKINIENIYRCKTLSSNSNNPIDVRTIAKQTASKSFQINHLIEKCENKRKTILKHYIDMYEKCIKKIDIANNLNKTDLLYTVKQYIPECPGYRSIDCVEYIRNKLHDNFLDTCRIDDCTIFITWLYIEVNKENMAKEKI